MRCPNCDENEVVITEQTDWPHLMRLCLNCGYQEEAAENEKEIYRQENS